MSCLVSEDLDTVLFQELTVTEQVLISAIRPHIFIHDSPPGSLRVDIYDQANTTLIKSSEEFTIADIKTQAGITDTYFHGYIRFLIDHGFNAGDVINVRLVGASGYVRTDTDYIAWCRDYDLRKYEATYTPNNSQSSAFDMEVCRYDDGVREL